MSTIVRWNPRREMATMQSTLNRLFNDTWHTTWTSVAAHLPIDAYETDNEYRVVVDVPGVSQDNINITIHQNVLTVSVDIPQPETPEGQRMLAQERTYGKFSRSIALPRTINSEQVEAIYEDGVLTLMLPIAPEAQPKRITVKSNGHLLHSNN
jgi:HSP20 family protein